MSDAIVNIKTNGLGLKNDALRGAFSRDGIRCFLLKKSGQTQKYIAVTELTSGYRIKFNDNRAESGLFRHATRTAGFRDLWAETHAVAYGVPNDDDEIEVYSFVPNEKDSIDPDGSSVYWSGRIVREPTERYTIPAIP